MVRGIGGSLFPGQYLADGLEAHLSALGPAPWLEQRRRHLLQWWEQTELTCGPATGMRAIVDTVAAPLTGALGFHMRAVSFERNHARIELASSGGAVVALLVFPWASGHHGVWRDAVETAAALRARWCFVLSPPSFSLLDTRGHVIRHSVDFTLPDVLEIGSFERFWLLARTLSFERASGIDELVRHATRFQHAVRADLQEGVLEALGALRRVLGRRSGAGESLTLVYRLLFLLFAESRDLVPRSHPVYERAYSIASFCHAAASTADPRGMWHGLAAITRLSRMGCRVDDLIVRPFNGRLFARAAAPSLESESRRRRPTRVTDARDRAMRDALVAIGTRAGARGREHITYADLGVEQLGAVYERILDADVDERRPVARSTRAHSARRKQTGTFYTPQPLAEFVVRRTLAPLVAGASSDAILTLRVVDPAMGSGAFLVAACRYLASAYERALVDEGRCAESDLDEHERARIRRSIAEHCLAGVDANPVAVQLARLSLWLTTLARGKPLSFLDHRLRTGNSLIGASPDLVVTGNAGPPWRRAVRDAGALPLFDAAGLEHSLQLVTRPLIEFTRRPDDSVDVVKEKEAIWSQLNGPDSPISSWRQAADFWCARWFMPSPPSSAEARAVCDRLLKHDTTLPASQLTRWLGHSRNAAAEHGFFHWPLEFADRFYDADGRAREGAGFDAVIGNPPWEMIRRDQTGLPDAPRTTHDVSRTTHDASAGASAGRASHNAIVRFVRDSGLYPSCDRGHLNLYQPFVERALALTRPGGRVGLILPWGLAVDDGATRLRQLLLERGGLDTIVGLDNSGGLFPIHRGLRFVVAVATPGRPAHSIRARFGIRTAEEIDDLPDRDDDTAPWVRLSSDQLRTIGGAARRIPDLRRSSDLAFLEQLAREHPALGETRGWSAQFGRELNATEDRGSFGPRGLPVIEGKHVSPFSVDVRSTSQHIDRRVALELLPDLRFDRPRLGYRDVSGVGNRLSLIAAVIPAGVVTTHTVFCLRTRLPLDQQHFLCGLFNSWVLNAIVRMLMGGHVTTSLVEGLPVPPWTGDDAQRRIARLARALSRRPHALSIAAELQASVARLYALDADMFAHLLESFPLVPDAERKSALAMLTR